MRGSGRLSCALGLVAGFALPAAGQELEARTAPLDIDLEEQVQVQLVLVEALVLDRQDRTIADLNLEDFELLVDHKPVEIATLDSDCAAGSERDAQVGGSRREPPPALSASAAPRRYVLVFDYYHLEHVAEALELAAEAFARLHVPGEEYMLVSLGQILRIEEPFTQDAQQILDGMERMKHDLGLYFGAYDRLTERRFFDRILTLFDVMELLQGPKAVVLFSGPFIPDGFTHDPTFKKMGAMAARARTAIYTIDSGGLRTLYDSNPQPFGGPPMLRRLSLETGGRPSADTNDMGLAFARAQRDYGCRYTLGFYDQRPQPDRDRILRVFVRRPGHRVVHPAFYTVRSKETQLRSRVRSARMMPQMFVDQSVSTDVRLVRPRSTSSWQAAVDIEIAAGLLTANAADEPWELRGSLARLNGTRIRRFRRTLTSSPETWAEGATLLELLNVPAGRYQLSVVLSHPRLERPLAALREVQIPEVPRNELFLVGPLLGRAGTFDEPDVPLRLHSGEVRPGEPLAALTQVCYVGREAQQPSAHLRRSLTSNSGAAVRNFDPQTLDLGPDGRVRCRPVIDRWPTDSLEPGRYRLTAEADGVAPAPPDPRAEFLVLVGDE